MLLEAIGNQLVGHQSRSLLIPVDKTVAMNVNGVGVRKDWVLVLSGRVHQTKTIILAFDFDIFNESLMKSQCKQLVQ